MEKHVRRKERMKEDKRKLHISEIANSYPEILIFFLDYVKRRFSLGISMLDTIIHIEE